MAAAALHTDRQWVWWYAWLGGIVLLAMAFVAICAITGELGSVKYNLEQQIATENSRRADMVRSINMTGTYGNLRPTAGADKLTNQPAGVLKVKGCKALPPERLSVLSSAQPYCAHAPAAEGGGTGPALAGVYSP